MNLTRTAAVIAIAILSCAGCRHEKFLAQDRLGAVHVSSFMGPSIVTITNVQCAGRVVLAQGSAMVSDGCFSGDSNIVICTDATSASPVKCAAGKDVLSIEGKGSDTINYARIR